MKRLTESLVKEDKCTMYRKQQHTRYLAATAMFRDDLSGMLVTAGSANAYTLTSAGGATTLRTVLLFAMADRANTGAATLTVDAAALKDLKKNGGVALISGELIEAGNTRRFTSRRPTNGGCIPLLESVISSH